MPKNNTNKRMKINYTVFSSVIQMFICLTLLMMPTVRAEAHDGEDHDYLPKPTINVDATAFSPNNDDVREKISVFYTIPDQRTIAEAEAIAGTAAEAAIAVKYIVKMALIFEQNGQSTGIPWTNGRTAEGEHVYVWDGEDGSNRELPDGTYKLKLSVTYRHFEDVVRRDAQSEVRLKTQLNRDGFDIRDIGTGENQVLVVEDQRNHVGGEPRQFKGGERVDIDRDEALELLEVVSEDRVTYSELLGGITDGFGEHDHVKLSDATTDIIIDREPPIIARVQANGNVNLVDGGYIAGSLTAITVTADKGSGTDIDFTAHETAISLTDKDGNVLSGATTLQGTTLTLTLGNPLDTRGENGTYTLTYTIVDKAGNAAEGTTTFTYDTVAPTLVSVATSNGDIPPSRGVKGEVTFVEATFEDNLEDGFSRGSSTILLTAPDDLPVLGRQLSPEEDKIRLEFLTPLVSPDGERDGTYTIVIDAVDRAGNRTETQVPFIYDNRAPQLVTLSASEDGEAFSGIQQRLYHSAPLYQIVATFDDGDTGTGVDVEKGATIEFGRRRDGALNLLPGRVFPDRDNNRIAFLLDEPLVSRDGSQDGIYRLNLKIADRIGNEDNEDLHNFQFIYDTQIPTLVSTVPAANETVSSLTQVQVNLKESTSGIDFVQSTFRLMRSDAAGDAEVPVNITSNGTETATLTVLAPFAVDGSDDGLYVIEVTPLDRAGNQGAAARREFFLVSQRAPKIRLLRPETSTVNSLTSDAEGLVAVELVDYIGVGIDFDASTLVVKSPGGVPIPRNIAPAPADEENRRLTWRTETVLPDDGSADGEYTITATFVDFNGQRWTEDFTFNVDTQFPRITSVQALTKTPMDMGAERIPVIAEAFSRIAVGFEEDDIDIGNTAVVLTGPGGTDIAINLNVNVARGTGTRGSTVNLNFSTLLASGDYTLSITPQDYFGNVSPRPFVYRFRLNVDTELPAITSVVALTTPPTGIRSERIPVIEEGFSRITVTFEETAGDAPTPLDIDIGNTAVSLTGPDDADIAINVTHDGNNSLTLNFSRLTASGNYSLSVTPQDYAGNVSPRPFVYPFRLDLALPKVSAVEIGGKIGTVVYVNGGATRIVATLADPTGTGLAFGNEGSRISITNADGTEIPGVTTVQGTNQLVWQAIGQPTDGTADGRYTVTVTPIDKAGRQGEVARRQFIYDTQPPQITEASPLSLTQPVTFVRAGFASDTQLQFTVADVGPAGVKMAEQTAQLLGADGTVLSTVVTRNQTDLVFLTLTEPLARDGSADGSYVVSVSLVDRAGNETKAEYAVAYDTLVPHVTGVTLNTAEPTRLVATQPTVITELGFSELDIAFEEATTRVDFANTTITLTGPDDTAVPLTLTPQGKAQVKAAFVAPQALGIYTLSITPQDIAGNTASGAVTYRFRLDVDLPSVSSVVIDGKAGGIVYVNGAAASIVATLADPSGAGIALGEGGSTITVANATGIPVPGETTDNGVDTLTWVPGVLPLDGTADGRYTVTITPRDKAGRQGNAVYRQFVFDTQPPRVNEATPIELTQPRTYINASFAQNPQVQFTVADVGPAALDLAVQRVHFRTADGTEVPAAMKHNEAGNETGNETGQVFLTLTDPLPIDGSADGDYTVTLTLIDRAGNETKADYVVVYDTQVPQVTGVTLNTTEPTPLVATQPTVITELGFSELDIAFEEATTRVDFANTTVTLTAPEDETLSLTLVPEGEAALSAQFVAPQALGIYTLSITPQDIAGNTASGAVTYRFRLDVDLPSVSSVVIDGKAGGIVYVNGAAASIVATLADPSGAGVALGEGGSTITVANATGTPVPGTTTDDGVDTLTWVPGALPLDGTADGRYTVTITPRDKAGRQGEPVYRQFVFDTQPPEITDASPMDLSQPVTYLSEFSQISVTVADVGPAEFWVEEQVMTLLDTAGNAVAANLTHNETDRIFLTLPQPLAKDGSEDGEYTVQVTLVDKSGNKYAAEHSIVYDTQAPQLVSTVPADGDILTDDVSQVQATLEDAGGSGIDFAATTFTLVAPDGTSITGALSNDGESELTLNLNPLVEDGRYRIRVEARDRAGNGDELRFERSFLLSRTLPSVVSTEPVTAPAEDAFTNERISQIEVTLESADATTEAKHLSTLRLLGPGASVIPGQQQREASRLTYTLARPLAQDGSEDGIYTIEFTPISPSGRSGDVQRLTFTYDTEAPELESEDIQLVVAESGVNNSLTEIRVKLTDNQSGIDWENLDDDWLSLERIAPNASNGEKTISGKVEDASQDTLRFRLASPLADDGSNDGQYRITVSPKDRAGNGSEPYEKVFTYDTAPPVIDDSTLLINDAPLLVDANALDYPTAISTTGGVVIQANMFDNGLGVNLAQSRIVVRAPDGAQLTGTTQQNGVDTLVFKSAGLNTRGLYQVTVTSVGNDSEFLGFAPQDSITTEFLYETTVPTATITSDGGEKELTDEALPLEGTATDPSGTQRIGDREQPVPASGVWLVEIVGTGPDGQPIEPVPAVDDSNAEEEPWSRWSLDFLPSRSGEYDLDVRVTDNAGNYDVYDIGKYTMSVSLTFRGSTFGWPNPLRISKGDVAFFSFDVNVPMGDTVELTLSIYDWSGDMVLSRTYPDVVSGIRNDQLLKWDLRNQAGNSVARGIYVFRLEAVNATGNRANVVGKVLVVD